MLGVLEADDNGALLHEVVHVEEDLLDLTLGLGGDGGAVDGLHHTVEAILPGQGAVLRRGRGQGGRRDGGGPAAAAEASSRAVRAARSAEAKAWS